MNSEEFIKECIKRGYVSQSDTNCLKKWVEKNHKDCYTDEDCIDAYRYFDAHIYTCNTWRNMYDGNKSTKHYKNFSFYG